MKYEDMKGSAKKFALRPKKFAKKFGSERRWSPVDPSRWKKRVVPHGVILIGIVGRELNFF